jgi:MFS family permease
MTTIHSGLDAADGEPAHAHPFVFLLLIMPFGAMGGYLTVTLAYQLAQAGVAEEVIGGLVALSIAPHAWKFLWAPLVDTTLTRKAWYMLGAVGTALGILAMGLVPARGESIGALSVAIFVATVATSFMGMAVESFMAHGTPPHLKGRAGGWFQAGNLGGQGLGGGAGLWLAQHLAAPWMAGAILAALCMACALPLLRVPEPPAVHRQGSYLASLGMVLRDLWEVAKSRAGVMALLILFLPIGTGAASNLWASIADDWKASADTVALVNGALNGLVSAAGCIVGGFICDRLDRKTAYALYGLSLALCAALMAAVPRTPDMFVLFTLTYAFITGLAYAGFSAVVLEAIGQGAAATKYSLFASLSNMPIVYMTVINGWAHTRWGAGGMLLTEAGMGVLGLGVFVVVAVLVRKRVAPRQQP